MPNYPCKNDWWGRPFLRENLAHTDPPAFKTPIFDLFSILNDYDDDVPCSISE